MIYICDINIVFFKCIKKLMSKHICSIIKNFFIRILISYPSIHLGNLIVYSIVIVLFINI